MKIGAWIHSGDGLSLDAQILSAAEHGVTSIRCYEIDYARTVAPTLKKTGITLMAGMHIDAPALLNDWRSQVRFDELAKYHELGLSIEAVCVGNELREPAGGPFKRRFSARLAFALANVLNTYREWLDEHELNTPLTYAMENISFGPRSQFDDWLWPLIDACDVVSVNAYPMDAPAWFSFDAFEESRRLLQDARERHLRFNSFELHLRHILEQLALVSKPLVLSETGFPSAVAYTRQDDRHVSAVSDNEHFSDAMHEFMDLVRRVDRDYDGLIKILYFYEWRDNLTHGAIWDDPPSPIHTAFGLCDRSGAPKLDIRSLIRE